MKKALVLSGGGALGSYQIGVWKALRKLNIKIDIVTGTSVGAINGGWIVQNDYHKAVRMWNCMSFNKLFCEEIDSDTESAAGLIEFAGLVTKKLVKQGGMDPVKFEKLVHKHLKTTKFYSSKIDYGLITVKLPDMKPVSLTKEHINPYKLADYIVASSTWFPVYQTKKIDGISYIDGGYRDNLPVELAIDMGAKEIIAVDVSMLPTSGVSKKIRNKIIYITPRNDIGSFFTFSKKRTKMNMKLGYNDTMKTFGRLEGNKYTFKKGTYSKVSKKYNKKTIEIINQIFNTSKANFFTKAAFKITDYYKMVNNEEYFNKTVYSAMEYLAKVYNINPSEVYSLSKFNRTILHEIENTHIKNLTKIETKIKTREVSNIFSSKVIIKYMFEKLKKTDKTKKARKDLSKLALLLPKEFISAMYVYQIYINDKKFSII